MSSRVRVMVVGVIGALLFIAIGLGQILPWVFAGPIAATFVTRWVLTEVHESIKGSSTEIQEEPKSKSKLKKKQARTISFENSL